MRRFEAWVVGIHNGEPFEHFLGRTFTRFGSRQKIHHSIGTDVWRKTQQYAFLTGHGIRVHGEVRARTDED